ncbi:MAG: alpha/beta hydrolase [Gordonia sp. (in: high G+C Gram-positive bacteria)]
MYWDISADLTPPADFDESKKYPAVISAHPIGSCTEQTSGNIYAARLSAERFVVIAFDASFQGASGGRPRLLKAGPLCVSAARRAASVQHREQETCDNPRTSSDVHHSM